MRPLLAVLILAAAAPLRAADPPPFDAAAAAKLLAPFVDAQTLAVARVDVAAIDLDAATDTLAKYAGQGPRGLGRARPGGRRFPARFTRAGGRGAFVILRAAGLPTPGPVVVVPAPPGADKAALKKVLESFPVK